MAWIGRSGLLTAGLLLAGCASQPPLQQQTSLPVAQLNAVPLDAFALDGRMAVHAGDKSGQVSVHWQHTRTSDVLSFYSPLGQTLGILTSDASGAVLMDADQHSQRGASAAALSQQWLGWPLPLDGLSFWVVGSSEPGSDFVADHDGGQSGLLRLAQSGWTVTYQHWREVGGRRLPDRLTLAGAGVTAKWVVSRWQVAP